MNLKTFNESFRKYYTEDIDDEVAESSFELELRDRLDKGTAILARILPRMDVNAYANAFYKVIEEMVPGKSWWEVTDCDIANELFNTHDVFGTIDCVIDSLKPEYRDLHERIDEVANDESCDGRLKESYDEPEVLGKGYAAPTSRDFVKEVRVKLKYNAFEDLEDLQKYMDSTIKDVEEFDAYWQAHKKAIMKDIKEAQDLIPSKYRK